MRTQKTSLCGVAFTNCKLIQLLCFQEEITDPVPSENTDSSSASISIETVGETDPFRKFQDIRHQDFGEIVFRKTKKSKKKANKGMLSNGFS